MPSKRDLEHKLSEYTSKLERVQKAYNDQLVAREIIEKELQREKHKRLLAEKERDAYSGAYEASLKHFERWSKSKLNRKDVPMTK